MNTFIGILDRAPLSIAVLSLALALVVASDRTFRQWVAAVVFLLPLSPIFAVRILANLTLLLTDALLTMRWAEPFARRAKWLAEHHDL